MIQKLPDFDNPLTVWVEKKKQLYFAISQLKKYGARENKDFVVKERGISKDYKEYAIFLNYKVVNKG